jgi:hypothetical protein
MAVEFWWILKTASAFSDAAPAPSEALRRSFPLVLDGK